MAIRKLLAGLARRVAQALESDAPAGGAAGEALRGQKFTSDLLESVPAALAFRDPEGRHLFVNRMWERYYGRRREDVIGRHIREVTPEAERVMRLDRAAMAEPPGTPVQAEFWVRERCYTQTRTAVADAEGGILGVLSAAIDTTERRLAERALAAERERLEDQVVLTRALIEENPSPMYLKDLEGRYVTVNEAWLRMVGLKREQALGRTVLELFPEKESERYHAEDLRLLAAGEGGSEMESMRTGPDGRAQWVMVRKAVLRRADGAVIGLIGSNTDITRLKRYEQELAERAKFVSELVDSLPISVAMRDPEGRYLLVNRTWERYFGIRREDCLGKRRRDLPGWQSQAAREIEDIDREMLDLGPDYVAEPQETQRLGRYYLITRRALFGSDGKPLGVLSAGIDTTERRAMEEAQRNQVKFINDLFDSVPMSLAMRDTEGRFLYVNRMWETYIGRKREAVIGTRVHDCLPQQEADAILADDRAALARGPDAPLELAEFVFRGRHLMQTRTVMSDAQGRTLGVLVASLDVTERQAMAAALATEQRRLDLVVRAARVGIVDWDGRTHATFYSPRFREIRGYPPDADTSAWPDYFRDMIHPEDRERVSRRFRNYVIGKGPDGPQEFYTPEEYRLLRADGSYVWIQSEGIAVRDEKGFVTRFIAAITDISERRAQEEALRASVRLREEVERMSRHDLKTPLASVIAVSRLLREGGRLPPGDDELLGTVERAGYRILNMVNLSLDLFRMESGTYQFRPQAIDLDGIVAKVVTDLRSQAASKNVELAVKREAVAVAWAEELLCYSMFANLVKNALEAAPEGGTVSITLARDGAAVLARVHNPGTVPQAVRERFFQKYATSGKSAGLGLGSYSARLMARVQQGDLTLETSEAAGTTLTVRLAAAQQPAVAVADEAAAPAPAAPPELPALRVLVVDDDEFNRLVLRRYLPSPPLRVTMAVNGRAALDAAARAWPDVVLLDLEMPVMDGYETARRLREIEAAGQRKRCTIVAISSNDEETIVQRALAAGCDRYLMKPAPRGLLLQILAGASVAEVAQEKAGESAVSDPVLLDPDLEASLPAFLASRREALDEMPQALAAGDRARFKRLAHKLAGSFSLYGFKWAAAQCRALEREFEGDAAELAQRAAAVRGYLDTVRLEVKA